MKTEEEHIEDFNLHFESLITKTQNVCTMRNISIKKQYGSSFSLFHKSEMFRLRRVVKSFIIHTILNDDRFKIFAISQFEIKTPANGASHCSSLHIAKIPEETDLIGG